MILDQTREVGVEEPVQEGVSWDRVEEEQDICGGSPAK